MDETLYVWLAGGRSSVRLLHTAFDRRLDWGDCESDAIDVVANGIYGHVVAASRATSVWEVPGLRGGGTVPKGWKMMERSAT